MVIALASGFIASSAVAAESTRLDPIVVNVGDPEHQPDDGYWPWLERFLTEHRQLRQRVTEIRHKLGSLAKGRKSDREAWLELLYRENRTIPPVQYGSGWDGYFGVASASELVNELGRPTAAENLVEAYKFYTSLMFGSPIPVDEPPQLGPQAVASFRQRRNDLRDEINASKAE